MPTSASPGTNYTGNKPAGASIEIYVERYQWVQPPGAQFPVQQMTPFNLKNVAPTTTWSLLPASTEKGYYYHMARMVDANGPGPWTYLGSYSIP